MVKKMKKTKRLALLCLLLVASIGSAVVVQATGVMQRFGITETAEINISSASVSLILTAEDRQKVTDIVFMEPQIQALLEAADEYTLEVSEVFDIKDISFEFEAFNNAIQLVPKEGIAQATITINNDYGEEFGVQIVTVTVDLVKEEIINIDVEPETVRPKEQEDLISINELVQDATNYDGVVVRVSGKVSLLGEVFSSIFKLDETVTVFYAHEQATVDVSNIENGDIVTVTGKFAAPDTIYATIIQKN
jgi:hypothetical protein